MKLCKYWKMRPQALEYRWPFICMLLPFLLLLSGTAVASPFLAGERARYQVRWSFVTAGQVEISVEREKHFEEKDAYHFSLSAMTLPFIDVFYKVRDRIDSFTDADVSHSLHYSKVQTGNSKRDIEVLFDWQEQMVSYRNFTEKLQPVKIEDGTFDPLSAYFFLRTQDIRSLKHIARPVTDGKKLVQGKAKILGRERITVPAGEFDTYLVEPDMKDARGVFEKSKNARLLVWLTADERHLLVKGQSKVVVGNIVAELVSFETQTVQ